MVETEEGSRWDFPTQQDEQNSGTFLLEEETLHWCKTSLRTWEWRWPNLECHKEGRLGVITTLFTSLVLKAEGELKDNSAEVEGGAAEEDNKVDSGWSLRLGKQYSPSTPTTPWSKTSFVPWDLTRQWS